MKSLQIAGSWLTLTRVCQARCGWCYAQDTKFRSEDTMSLSLARELAGIIASTGSDSVVLIGGEPTVHKDFFEIVRMLRGFKLRPDLITNGFKLANRRFVDRLVESDIGNVSISLKADSDECYERFTKVKRGFSRVQQAFKNCREAKLPVTLSVTVTDNFVNQPDAFLDAIKGLEPRYIDFGLANPIVKVDGVQATSIPDPASSAKMVTLIHDVLKNTSLEYGFEMNIPFCLLDLTTKQELLQKNRIRRGCHIPTGSGLIFDEKGSVMPCNLFTSHSIGRLGTEFSTAQEFHVFWNSTGMSEFRERIAAYPHKKCAGCPEWDMCGGGCKIKWMYWDPRQYIKGL